VTQDIHSEKILILDFGSQYTQLIARCIREMGVYCEIHPYDLADTIIQTFDPAGIILSGGPATATADNTPRAPDSIFQLGCPILGICYGMQTIAAQLGGKVAMASHQEFGQATITLQQSSPLLQDIKDLNQKNQATVWMSHGDHVTTLPQNFVVIASSNNAPIAAIADEQKDFYGVQFHPEVTHTPQGNAILKRFVKHICQCHTLWQANRIITDIITHIKKQVANEQVILGLSGGVDSSVTAALLHKAIGKQLTCVFVDTGLLRQNEAEQVMATFNTHLGVNIIMVNAEQQFFNALQGITDPEKKRQIIGKVFIDIFQEQAKQLTQANWLAQGTIYPDVIESAGIGKASVIKSHHNVGGLPANMSLKLLEPLRELFKDEVRKLGLELGLPYDMVYRHPFPGPGLAVRVLAEVKIEYVNIVRQADAIFLEELHKHDFYHQVSQAFAVFLPVKSVGVKGDARHYDYVIALRAVETIDFMTARWAHLPHELLATVANRIINEVQGVSRVTYDISSKPPATIEWE